MNWLQKLNQKPMALPYDRPRGDNPKPGYARIDSTMTEPAAEQEKERYPGIEFFNAGTMGLVSRIAPGVLMKYTDDREEAEVAHEAWEQGHTFMVPILEEPREIPGKKSLWAIIAKEIEPLTQSQQWVTGFLDPTNPENGGSEVEFGLPGGFPSIDRTMDVFTTPSVYYHVDVDEIWKVYNAYKTFTQDMLRAGYRLGDALGSNLGWNEGRIVLLDLGFAKL